MPAPLPEQPAGPDSVAEESRWLERARAGDERAFGQLMQLHYESIFRRVVSIVRNEHDARDLCQEIWLQVWQQLAKFRGESRFRTWLFTLATRRTLDHLRRRRRWFDRFVSFARLPARQGESDTVWEPADSSPGVGTQLEHRERNEQLERAMGKLPAELRAVLALRDIEGLTYDEIATTLNWPLGTVMSRLHKARRQLTHLLKDFPCD